MKTPQKTVVDESDPLTTASQLEALTAHYERAYGGLRLHAISIVGSPEVADDIVQEAFVNTTAAIERGTQIVYLNAWLKRCVRNLSMNYLELKPLLPLEEAEEIASDDSPLEAAHAKSACAAVYSAMKGLTPAQRSAFLMAEVHGFDYREIASRLGRSVDSVRHILFRARKYVRDTVGPETASATAPIMSLRPENLQAPRLTPQGLRDYIAAKLQNLSGAVSSVLQRSAEVVPQPAVAIVSGALAVGTIVGAPSGPRPLIETGNTGPRAVAVVPISPSQPLSSDNGALAPSHSDTQESDNKLAPFPGSAGKDNRGADEDNAGRVALDDLSGGANASTINSPQASKEIGNSTYIDGQSRGDEQSEDAPSDGSCQTESGSGSSGAACNSPIAPVSAPPGAERTGDFDRLAVDPPRTSFVNGSSSDSGDTTSGSDAPDQTDGSGADSDITANGVQSTGQADISAASKTASPMSK